MAVIDQVVRQLQARQEELDATITAALGERERIDSAIAAVTSSPSASSDGRRSPAARKPGARPGSRRAPRGQNRQKILEAAANGPKTVNEIAGITKIKKTTVAATVSTMTKKGLLTRTPDGGYRAAALGSSDAGRKPTARKTSRSTAAR
jgi:DNA-binding NarL/FixJ family response regulator